MASIAKRTTSDGEKKYDVRWWADGRQSKKTFRRFEDARAFKRQVEADDVAGLVTDLRATGESLESFAERWLATRLVKGRPLAPTTVQGYRGLLARNILAKVVDVHLGPMPLRKITPPVVRAWHAEVATHKGQDQAAKSYRLLRAILATAVADDVLRANPCRIPGGGTEHAEERPMVSLEDVLALADAIDERYRALVLVAGLAGLRTGESLGLRRVDVDPMRAVVYVRQQAQEVAGLGRVVGDPKSAAGVRQVVVPKLLAEELELHIGQYAQPGAEGFVFTGPEGTPLRRATLSEAWRAAVASTGQPAGLHLHDLRHHAATMTARSGATTKELMARIGHSSPRAALIYQHATEERDRAIASYLDQQIAQVARPRLAAVVPIDGSARAMDVPSSAG